MNRSPKTILLVAIALLAVSVAWPASAGLLDLPQFQDPCDVCEFVRLVSEIKNIILEVAAPVAVLFVIIGGVLMTTAAGMPERARQARTIIKAAIIGLVIILCAWLIVSAVMAALFGRDVGSSWWTISCPEDTRCRYQQTSGPEAPTGENPEGCGEGVAGIGMSQVGTCWGPCHCAFFVSRALEGTGCKGAYNPTVSGLQGWLSSHGWQQVSTPQAGDIGFDGGHVGIMTSATTAVHSKVINEDGTNTACAGKCTKLAPSCPECQGAAGDPRGSFADSYCVSNQCVTSESKTFGTYYRRPANQTNTNTNSTTP